MSVQEGLNGSLAINGTVIAALAEVTFEHTRDAVEWQPLGSVSVSDVLWGLNKYRATARHGYVDTLWATLVTDGSVLPGTLYAYTGKTIAGTFACVKHGISGIVMGSKDPVIEDLEFIMYNVTFA